MATWKVILSDGTEKQISAHQAAIVDNGALVFRDNCDDCPKVFLASGTWNYCIRENANPGGFPVRG